MGVAKVFLGAIVGWILGTTMMQATNAIERLESFNVIHHPFGPVTQVLREIGPHPIAVICLVLGACVGLLSAMRDHKIDEQLAEIRSRLKE